MATYDNQEEMNQHFSPNFYTNMFSRDQLAEFAEFKTSMEKVEFIHGLVTKSESISLINFIPKVKSDVFSYQTSLNEQQAEDWGSFKPINKALANAATAPLKAMIYAQRAGAFFAVRLYKQCMNDIDRAIANGYPGEDETHLTSLKQKAKDLLNNAGKPKLYFQIVPLMENINHLIPSASASVKIRREPRWGKHIVATKHIKIGEVIVVEKPFVAQLTEFDQPYCQQCFALCYDLIPCEHCTYFFFCSEACQKNAWMKHHKFICPLLPTLEALGMLQTSRLMTLKAVLQNVIEEHPKLTSYSYTSVDVPYHSDTYKEIYNMSTNNDERSQSELIKEAYLTSVILHLVDTYTDFFQGIHGSNKKLLEKTFKRLVYIHMGICRTNHLAIFETQTQTLHKVNLKFRATGLYSVGSLFNHSCAANVKFNFHGTTLVVRAIKPIRAGEQLFVSYARCNYFNDTRLVRQCQLISEYDFHCQCLACRNNWPNWEFLKGDIIEKALEEEYADVLKGDMEKSKEMLPKLLDDYNKVFREKKEPCREIYILHQLISVCYNNFGNYVSRRL